MLTKTRYITTAGPSLLIAAAFGILSFAPASQAQVFQLSREQMIRYTPQNPFDRLPDGRPKVPDELLEKFKKMSAEEVLPIVRRGYPNQYVDGFHILSPGKIMVGRAMTLQLMPSRGRGPGGVETEESRPPVAPDRSRHASERRCLRGRRPR